MEKRFMDFSLFTMTIISHLQEEMGENYKLTLSSVRKNNGVELTGIIFDEKGKNTSPTIYLNELYESYKNGMELIEIVNVVRQTFQKTRLKESLDMGDFLDYEKAKKNIAVKVVNYEKNFEELMQIPHKRICNLAIVCYYAVHQTPFHGKAFIMIRNSHLKHWGITFQELYKNALQMTPKLYPAMVLSMEEAMEQTEGETMEEEESEEGQPMFILTNTDKMHGAVCMFYPGVLKEFAEEQQKNLYILPSSVHEVILLPADEELQPAELLDMVREINRTSVEDSEVLADSVYFYHRRTGDITVYS